MKRVILALLTLGTALAILPAASAQNYNFTLNGASSGDNANATGSGTLALTFEGSSWVVTSMSGTFDGNSITLLPAGGYAGNDNVFLPSGTPSYFDFSGLSFAANSIDYNLFYDGSTGTYILDSVNDPGGSPYSGQTQVSFSAPEGGSSLLYLLLAGGSCFGVMFFGSRYRVGSRTMA
jgi:hypothetical protein